MYQLNPLAFFFWLFCGGIGYLITTSLYGFIAGLVAGFFISFLTMIIPDK